jgi:integrase
MLTDIKLKALKPRAKAYKVADRDGLYVTVSTAGVVTFRYDYRLNDRRETLTIGRYDPFQAARQRGQDGPGEALEYGVPLCLADARHLLLRARNAVGHGRSPAREKADGKVVKDMDLTFSNFTVIWLRDAGLADSTIAMRKSILDRDILPAFGRRLLEEIQPSEVMALCDKIKARGAPATAVHAREIVSQVYRHAIGRGLKVDNPADRIKSSAIASFKPRSRALAPAEIRTFFTMLETMGTLPTIKLALKLVLLTLCRKGELLQGTWSEVDFEAATWTIPAERMKARRPHVVYLSQQVLDIFVALKTCAGTSNYLLPGRYDAEITISDATLNRVITATVAKAKKEGAGVGALQRSRSAAHGFDVAARGGL